MRIRAKNDESGELLCPKCKAPYIVYATFLPYVSCGECGWIPIREKIRKIKKFFKKLF